MNSGEDKKKTDDFEASARKFIIELKTKKAFLEVYITSIACYFPCWSQVVLVSLLKAHVDMCSLLREMLLKQMLIWV